MSNKRKATELEADATSSAIIENKVWVPPAKVEELFKTTTGNKFAGINAPTAGARVQEEIPVGEAPFQLYSLATPNGMKVSILLEELGVEYDAFKIAINGKQFTSGFVSVNPNSKIPAATDKLADGTVIKLFESGSIMLYLAEKYKRFIPSDPSLRAQVLNWLFWQVGGQGPMTGAAFGHFFVYAPADKGEAREYALARYGMEVQRLCSVLDNHLAGRTFMVGEEYTIADMACFPWFNQLRTGYIHESGVSASSFLSIEENYPHAVAWADRLLARAAVARGMVVCSWKSEETKPWLKKDDISDGKDVNNNK